MPATSKMFDLGNYTIDTGAYSPPPNVTIVPNATVVSPESLEWFWDNGENTFISIYPGHLHHEPPDDFDINNETYLQMNAANLLMQIYSGFENINLTYNSSNIDAEQFLDSFQDLDPVYVKKPYTGYIVISDRYPPAKIYVGAIDSFNYINIISTESDEMMALIMRELKVYAREESKTARLRAIQKIL